MLLSSQKIRFEDLRSLGFAGISAVYAGVGSSFGQPARMLEITNLTDANLLVSFNGISDKLALPAQTAKIYDWGSNKADQAGNAEQPVGDRVYVKAESVLPTVGNVYVSVIYLSEV